MFIKQQFWKNRLGGWLCFSLRSIIISTCIGCCLSFAKHMRANSFWLEISSLFAANFAQVLLIKVIKVNKVIIISGCGPSRDPFVQLFFLTAFQTCITSLFCLFFFNPKTVSSTWSFLWLSRFSHRLISVGVLLCPDWLLTQRDHAHCLRHTRCNRCGFTPCPVHSLWSN